MLSPLMGSTLTWIVNLFLSFKELTMCLFKKKKSEIISLGVIPAPQFLGNLAYS